MVVEKKIIFLTSHDETWEAEVWQSGPHSETQVKERKEGRKRGEERAGQGKVGEGREYFVSKPWS